MASFGVSDKTSHMISKSNSILLDERADASDDAYYPTPRSNSTFTDLLNDDMEPHFFQSFGEDVVNKAIGKNCYNAVKYVYVLIK
jgi:hypothetical protein